MVKAKGQPFDSTERDWEPQVSSDRIKDPREISSKLIARLAKTERIRFDITTVMLSNIPASAEHRPQLVFLTRPAH